MHQEEVAPGDPPADSPPGLFDFAFCAGVLFCHAETELEDPPTASRNASNGSPSRSRSARRSCGPHHPIQPYHTQVPSDENGAAAAADEDDLRMASLDLSTYDEERQDEDIRLFLLPRDVIIRWRDEFHADRRGSMDLRSLSALSRFPITRVRLCNIVDGTDPQLTARMNDKTGVALAFNHSAGLFDVRLDDDRPSDDTRQISIHNHQSRIEIKEDK